MFYLAIWPSEKCLSPHEHQVDHVMQNSISDIRQLQLYFDTDISVCIAGSDAQLYSTELQYTNYSSLVVKYRKGSMTQQYYIKHKIIYKL